MVTYVCVSFSAALPNISMTKSNWLFVVYDLHNAMRHFVGLLRSMSGDWVRAESSELRFGHIRQNGHAVGKKEKGNIRSSLGYFAIRAPKYHYRTSELRVHSSHCIQYFYMFSMLRKKLSTWHFAESFVQLFCIEYRKWRSQPIIRRKLPETWRQDDMFPSCQIYSVARKHWYITRFFYCQIAIGRAL